ncbi:bacterio-opsin activator [Paenibacillus sp. MBLB2552]|uniref:Bacterio-opsin activator n=1 Tax=Paenibacillus mellifer TaxID=2937794 RepID=A0A9X1Y2F3_9BACL|nr:bacterio-opsin activator [Paenibacillus mellifer]MCK8489539.1 bacterio-opsin activator [Paenibacillus mellifer]
MESIPISDPYVPRRYIVGFSREMASFKQWLTDPNPTTSLFDVSGIGGIGKTTLLLEMTKAASQAEVLTLWLDGQSELATSGAFLSGLGASLEIEYGRRREPGLPLLSFVIEELTRQRSVLLIDNCSRLAGIEGWLMSSFLPKLTDAGVLFVMASRGGLPLQWYTSPYWGHRIRAFPLSLLTREEVLDYLHRCGLDEMLRTEVAQKTKGLPLHLAMTVDVLHSKQSNPGASAGLDEIPGTLSADILREAASPDLFQALSVLSLLPAADQSTLNRLLDPPLDAAGYYALGNLSFVRRTAYGLTLHHVIAGLLRNDFAQRDAAQFQVRRQQVFQLLAEQFRHADTRQQRGIAAHIMELYREFLPSAHAYADFSTALSPGVHTPFRPEDLGSLQQLLAAAISPTNWQSELVHAKAYSALLDDIARHSPEGICVVRDDSGTPLAFCAGFWLHGSTLPMLDRYAPGILALLSDERVALRTLSRESADTLCVLLAAVDVRHPLYGPEELGALLMRQWLVEMTSGLRGIMFTADPQLNGLFQILGFQEMGHIKLNGTETEGELTRWELDFRHQTFDTWVKEVIRQTGPTGLTALMTRNESRAEMDGTAAKQILELLFRSEEMEQLPVVRKMGLRGTAVQTCVQNILTATEAGYPLTQLDQSILRAVYLQKDRNKNQLADDFHMSRTTFYRHTLQALDHMGHVLTRALSEVRG